MDLGIAGKRALVLASSRGLGKGIAEALAREGAHVLLCGRSAETLAANCEAINAEGTGRADWVQADTKVRNPYYGKSMLRCGSPKSAASETKA